MKYYLCLYENEDHFTTLKEADSLQELDEFTTNFDNSNAIRDSFLNESSQVAHKRTSVRIIALEKFGHSSKQHKVSILYKKEKIFLNYDYLITEIENKLFLPQYQKVLANLNLSFPSPSVEGQWRLLKSLTRVKLNQTIRKMREEAYAKYQSSSLYLERKEASDKMQCCDANLIDHKTLKNANITVNANFYRVTEEMYPKGENISKKQFITDLQTALISNVKKRYGSKHPSDKDKGYFYIRKIYSKLKSYEERDHLLQYYPSPVEPVELLDDFIRLPKEVSKEEYIETIESVRAYEKTYL